MTERTGVPTASEPASTRTRRTHLLVALTAAAAGIGLVAATIAFAGSGHQHTGSRAAVVAPATHGVSRVNVTLAEFHIDPARLVVAPGTHLYLVVRNGGHMEHDLRLSNGAHTRLLEPGQETTLDAGVVRTDLSGWCTVPGHRAAGMTMTITVGTAAAAAPTPQPGTGVMEMPGMPAESGVAAPNPADATAAALDTAPPPGWRPIDAALPAAPSGTVHKVTWHIRDVVTTVAPGVTQTLWTFDGRVPGPTLRGRVGDTFEVTVVNDTSMTHNLDFHAESGPPAEVMTPIPPGGRHTYTFVARYAGAWLYHCGTAPMLMHVANGMYGALIIDPPNLAPVDREYVLVASEFFFGPPRGPGDYAKMLADRPDTVVFNGYPFAYKWRPLTAVVGQRIRIWIVDAGPNRGVAFHVIGEPFTTTYVDGHYALQNTSDGAAQTLAVDPGDGGFVELTFSRPGDYPFVDHQMADAELGAMGTISVRTP
ncbi:multicopper oxidase, type 3 [Acidothermus cellulolyticus 11B]|uniref:Copper-containing nitrite reductase n=1 Tax=Acidothermus cellulolyticus (strain ATCC 43068 / DSM 8971 / 11B) TaxID=351607 RepID=A0LS66_ACIC1|nr:multicopper oxidase domain-containing protein [Acidothermus cellulolyticus]ABK52276.1 multicopper oxidase, type 3 [Acidothermus cellulolyticus 11B]